jgi:tetratricopeptide (TPR) repeat protein
MEKETLQLRLKDINDYLASHDRSSAAAAHLLLEAASAYERLGRWNDSMVCAQEAHSSFFALDNDRLAAQAKGQIADILQARGQLDQALLIWQEQVLPIFDALGYSTEADMARKRIAGLQVALLQRPKAKKSASTQRKR